MENTVIKKGDYVKTPRFLTVKISDVLVAEEAHKQGFTEPTHYESEDFAIYGKSTGTNRMIFAAVPLNEEAQAAAIQAEQQQAEQQQLLTQMNSIEMG